ncbi:MAG TPA: hypothetical protein VF158_11535 [Longimicrobiales bacterium]
MRFAWLIFGLGFVLMAESGCGLAPSRRAEAPWRAAYRERTGQVTELDLFLRLPRALARHGFVIERSDRRYRDYRFETQWRYRKPFADEFERGAVEARTRLHLRADWAGHLYELHLEAENSIRTMAGEWVDASVTRMFETYAHDIANTIRLEVTGGIRLY